LTVKRLADAGIPVSVNVAPIVPGLSDRDMPRILEAAAEAGARSAAMIVLRLPGPVAQVFDERLREHLPLSRDRVIARTRELRGGKLNDPRFGHRMRGHGEYASAIQALFDSTARRLGLAPARADGGREPPSGAPGAGPRALPRPGEQLGLFERG
jgi:DNA repair photolyase